jgi:replicative DNA helicase
MTPPFSIEAEKIVLGTVLLTPNVLPIAIQELKPEYFYRNEHRTIYECMVSLFEKSIGVDMITVFNEVSKKLKPFHISELVELQKNVISNIHFDYHVGVVKDKWVKRELIRLSTKTMANAANETASAKELIAEHNGEIYSISHEIQRDLPIGQLLSKLLAERSERKQGMRGIPSGYFSLDMTLNGFMKTDLVIVAGRPGQGKTAFAINLLVNLAVKRKVPSAFLSLEMTWEQLLERMESVYTGIEHSKLSQNNLTPQEHDKIIMAHEEIGNSPIYLSDMPRVDINTIRAKISLFKAKYDVHVVFLDYLQLVAGTGRKEAYERVSEVSMGLKAIAKEFNVCFVALAQLSREVEKRSDKMPQMSDLKESGQIEQDADRIIFLMRPEYYEIETIMTKAGEISTKGKILIKVAKNRHGSIGELNVMNWQPEFMRVTEM